MKIRNKIRLFLEKHIWIPTGSIRVTAGFVNFETTGAKDPTAGMAILECRYCRSYSWNWDTPNCPGLILNFLPGLPPRLLAEHLDSCWVKKLFVRIGYMDKKSLI